VHACKQREIERKRGREREREIERIVGKRERWESMKDRPHHFLIKKR
jgi:hypothetical protein